jgi:hypothetical protein
MTISELLAYIFEGRPGDASAQFEGWVRSSRRFRTFAETYRDKIRKKLRNLEDDEALKSLFAELEVAYCLLADQRFAIEYEKYGTGKQRGPDFSLHYRTNTLLNLEVTRLRSFQPMPETDVGMILARKLNDALLDKVGQMPAGTLNALLILGDFALSPDALSEVLVSLRRRAEAKQEDFFANRGFTDAADFLKYFRRLSVIYYRVVSRPSENAALTVWHNSLAKGVVPRDLLNALQHILADKQ